MAPSPDEENASRSESVVGTELTISGGTCSAKNIGTVKPVFPPPTHRLRRLPESHAWAVSVETTAKGAPPVEFAAGQMAMAAVSLDGAHVFVNETVNGPPMHYKVKVFDVRQGKIILEGPQPIWIDGVVIGDRLLAITGGLLSVIDLANGKTVWKDVASSFSYNGPYPP
jgi:hypothetical protein